MTGETGLQQAGRATDFTLILRQTSLIADNDKRVWTGIVQPLEEGESYVLSCLVLLHNYFLEKPLTFY